MDISVALGNDLAEIDEARLIDLARGDGEAFAELYRRHLRAVFSYLLTYVDSVDDAADLTQIVFLRAFESLPRYRAAGIPFRAWLFRIARNAALNTFRRRKPIPWDHVPAAWQPFVDDNPEPASVRREALNQLRVLVAELPPAKQEMLYLRFAGGLTAGEIGAVIDKSEAAVQKQINRTLHLLKERYRAMED